MAKYLVVVESPAKAKTINKFLGRNYVVKASYGHVRDLPKSDLGVDIGNGFAPKYVKPRDSSKAIKEIIAAAEKVDEVLLASDPDREGEAIGWHVAEILRGDKKTREKPIQRIVFNEITKPSVKKAAESPREIDYNLVNAQQARRVLDRLVGYKISPLLGWAVKRGLSAGRVQSVAVRMVVEREVEIRAFVPEEYWSLDAILATPRGDTFSARLVRVGGEKATRGEAGEVRSQAAMDAVLARLEGVSYRVTEIELKEMRRRPAPPFITSTLQQEASRRLRMNPRRTMGVAQGLYEGVEVGEEGTVGLITYMRTDSVRTADEAMAEVRAYIGATFEKGMLPESPNLYKSKKGAQDAHEAIRPTSVHRTPDLMRKYLSDEQLALYTIVWQRFVASQMAPAVYDQTAVDIAAGDCGFRATGSIMRFAGFTKVYEESRVDKNVDTEDEAKGADESRLLPPINKDETCDKRELRPEQHFTKPPPRYTEASLIRALEENGIGRPSTYAPTVQTIRDREYVLRDKGRLEPTDLGETVNKLLVDSFPDILDLTFTAQMEADLDHVEEGAREWVDVLREFYTKFEKDLTDAQKKMIAEKVGENVACPKCGSPVELKESWFGLFLGCTRYPDCDGTVRVKREAQTEPTDYTCAECGAPMVIRSSRFGKFMGCSTYPACKSTVQIDAEGKPIKSEVGAPCPLCGGDLVRKKGPRMRFVGCNNYPKCDFKIFGDVDLETPCPKCGHAYTALEKQRGKGSKNKPPMRKCVKCDYAEEAVELTPVAAPAEGGGET